MVLLSRSPAGAVGVDGSGRVEVVLAVDGLPESLRLTRAAGSVSRLEGAGWGSAVVGAFAAAHRANLAATVTAVVEALRERAAPAVCPPDVYGWPAAGSPSWSQLLDATDQTLDEVREWLARSATGDSPEGAVTVTLRPGPAPSVHCTVDERWADAAVPAMLDTAWAQAQARRALIAHEPDQLWGRSSSTWEAVFAAALAAIRDAGEHQPSQGRAGMRVGGGR